MSIDNIYGTTGVIPEVAVQATDTSTLVYRTEERYGINTMTISNNASPHNMVFHGKNGKEVGRMEFGDGELKFEGDASEAAKVFTEWCRKNWNDLRANDKREVLQQVMDDLLEEASGELYSEEEKIAILTCMQRVQARKKEHDAPQLVESGAQWGRSVGVKRDMSDPKPSVLSAIAPEGKSL